MFFTKNYFGAIIIKFLLFSYNISIIIKNITSFNYLDEKSNILIFDSIYYETLYILDGHTALIKDACISEDDFYVVSTCMSGFVYW